MSDTSSRGPGDDRIIADFDQTNGVLDDFEGESGGTAAGESRSAADREDDGVGGGGVLDDLRDGHTDPYVDGPDRMRSTGDDDVVRDTDDRDRDRDGFSPVDSDRDRLTDGRAGTGRRPGTAVAADAVEDDIIDPGTQGGRGAGY